MLKVTDVSFHYGDSKTAFGLKDVHFQLEKGYIMGVLGLNGAGKTTLIHLLLGFFVPDSGSILFEEEELDRGNTEQIQKIGFVSDDMQFLEFQTLQENVELFGGLYAYFDYNAWENYMERFDFTEEDRELCYGELSTGEKRKFQLAFALSYKPELLLLDEPTANLDPHARVEWMELVGKLAGEEELSVIMTTHLTEDLDERADYILILDKGRQVAYMNREEMVEQYGEIALSTLLLKEW